MTTTSTTRPAADASRPITEGAVSRPLLRGIHHLAINTDDLRATLDFYVRILGMPLVHGLITRPGAAERAKDRGNPPFDQIPHYFVDMGGDSLLAIFEFPKGAAPQADRNSVAGMQHMAFACGRKRFAEMHERVKRNGVKIVFGPQVVIPPAITSFYFFDPNGIRLEITTDMNGPEGQEGVDLSVTRSCTMTYDELRAELARVSDDDAWIASMLANMRQFN